MAEADAPSASRFARLIEPGSSLAPFRYVVFREIWVANLVSNLGSMIQSVAAQWLMTDLTHSHRLIAMVSTSSTIGIMLFGVFAGAIADNFDRRRVMLAAQMGMLVASALLAALTYAGLITPYLLLAFTLAVGIGTALNSPAWQASVRQQVAIADLPQAISLNSISFNLARCVGPALGGLLISLWNVSLAFAINAVSFIAMIFVLLRWHPAHSPPPRRAMLPTIAAGIRYCAGAPDIRRILLRGFVMGVGLAGYQALVPAVVRGQLHGTEVQFGLLLGLFGIGSILSALIIGEMRRRFGNEAVITVSALAFVAAQTVLAAAHSLTAALPASFIAGGGWVAGLTTINVIMQLKSPDEIIGRCMSIYQAVTFGGMAMGAWLWGTVADWGGLSVALHAASAWLLVTVVILRFVAPMPEIQPGQRARASS